MVFVLWNKLYLRTTFWILESTALKTTTKPSTEKRTLVFHETNKTKKMTLAFLLKDKQNRKDDVPSFVEHEEFVPALFKWNLTTYSYKILVEFIYSKGLLLGWVLKVLRLWPNIAQASWLSHASIMPCAQLCHKCLVPMHRVFFSEMLFKCLKNPSF